MVQISERKNNQPRKKQTQVAPADQTATRVVTDLPNLDSLSDPPKEALNSYDFYRIWIAGREYEIKGKDDKEEPTQYKFLNNDDEWIDDPGGMIIAERHTEAIASLVPPEMHAITTEGLRAVLEAAQAKRVQPIAELIARTRAETTAAARPRKYSEGVRPPVAPSRRHIADMTPEEQAATREKWRRAKAGPKP